MKVNASCRPRLDSVLVTGATGFLGRRLAERLQASGARVTCVSRSSAASLDGGWRRCNLEDADAVERLFDEIRPTHVLHLASLVTGSRELSAVIPTFRANLAAAVHLLTAAVQVGCRSVVLAGSMEEFPVDEPGRYPYAAAKRAASEYGRFFHQVYGLSAVTLRIGMVYGPGDRRSAGFIPHVVLSQLAGSRPRLSSGKRRVDWVFVDDVADAFVAAAAATDAGGKVLEIGAGRAVSLAEVAARLTAITGGPAPELGALPDRANDVDVVMDVEPTRKAIGWRPSVELGEGLTTYRRLVSRRTSGRSFLTVSIRQLGVGVGWNPVRRPRVPSARPQPRHARDPRVSVVAADVARDRGHRRRHGAPRVRRAVDHRSAWWYRRVHLLWGLQGWRDGRRDLTGQVVEVPASDWKVPCRVSSTRSHAPCTPCSRRSPSSGTGSR